AVDLFLKDRLRAARPDYGWLSEETVDDAARLSRRRVFVVDPIDGTRAFLAGRPEWAISAAVVEDGRPVAAALLQPAARLLLVAS
ncbi:3'(2'),5'-bisphosphate nucleotidase CysQ, partial [Mycobacterium tuberculosis]|nr:3'(2'),5'-bisphosphate nucleotidase CysQ [Mycobacterium tuberculosis]